MKEFCPRCGRETGPFIRGFCQECFQEKAKLVELPESIELEHCKKCGRVKVSGQWKEQNSFVVMAMVSSKIKGKELSVKDTDIELFQLDNGNTIANVKIIGSIDSTKMVVEREVLIKAKSAICDDCSRIAGSYYEATVQVRFSEKPTPELMHEKMLILEGIMKELKKKKGLAEIIKFSQDKHGFDAQIGDKKSAKIAAERMSRATGNPIKVSSTLVGLDRNGVEKYRFTFLVRY